MTSRILSFVALVGMLGAAGCSGGGAGTAASGLTTKTPVGGTIVPATGGSTFSMSFLMPGSGVLGTTSTGRKTAYISPGSSGIQMLFSDGVVAPTYAVGTAAQPFGLSLTPGTYNVNGAGTTYGSNATTPATPGFTPGNATNSVQFTDTGVVGTIVQIQTTPNSATSIPSVGQSLTIQGVGFTGVIQSIGAGSSQQAGYILQVKETAGTAAQVVPVNALITFQAGGTAAIVGTTFTYKIAAQTGSLAGYYLVTFTFNNVVGGIPYEIGVVVTDIATAGNPILSENQTAITPVAASGPTNFVQLTLQPVVAGVYIPAPLAVAANTSASGNPVGFESTIFVTDERGFVIPTQPGPPLVVADNTPVITITPTVAAQLTLGSYTGGGGYAPVAGVTTATVPTVAASYTAAAGNSLTVSNLAAGPNYGKVFGTFFNNVVNPTNGQALSVTFGAGPSSVGNPLSIACGATVVQSAGLKVTLSSVTPATVAGYTYTPGTNLPATAATALVTGQSSSFPNAANGVNCLPSIGLPLN